MKTALITGASAGLGYEFANLFAKDGYSLVLVARRKERLESIARELQDQYQGIKIDVLDQDLSEIGSGHKLVERLRAKGLRIDVLVNNAGIGTNGEFAMQPLGKELQMIDLNVRVMVELTHLLLPSMISNRFGKILNVGSTAGFQPGPQMATYYGSKAFVNSWSESLHEELKPQGISVTVLTPGPTATEFAQSAKMESVRFFKLMQTGNATAVAKVGYRAMQASRAIAIPGFMNRTQVQFNRIMPRSLLRKIVGYVNSKAERPKLGIPA
jgi:uncharacterized protein